jgi:beta-lactamase class A
MRLKRDVWIILVLLIITGCTNINTKKSEVKKVEIEESNINEDKEIALEKNNKLEKIKNSINDILGNYKDNVGIYYYNLSTEDKYTINEERCFFAASLIKVPQAMMLLDLVKSGDISLDTIIYYTESDYESGTGILQNKEIIEPITIKEAIELSIIYSDNIAFNMLLRVSGGNINEYIKKICNEENRPSDNNTTAYEQFKIYERLYKNPDGNPNYKFLIGLLKQTEFHDRLDKYIPMDLVAHKIGNYYRYYNDAGIIYLEEPYILVVLTKDIGKLSLEDPISGNEDERSLVDFGKEACELIANISKAIYDISSKS